MAAPQIASGDSLLNAVNAALTEIDAKVSSFDGSQIQAGTVANAALAKGKAIFTVSLGTDRDIWKGTGGGGANVTGVWSFKLPNVDGASSSNWKYIGCSVGFQEFTTIHPAGALLRIKKNGSTQHDVDLSNVTAAATPYQNNVVAAVSSTSGDTWTVDYVAGATGDVQYATVVLYFSQQHVGT